MIHIDQLHKRFDDVVAVDDVSLAARDGEVTGLLGPNGAGKTTTLRMLYGLLQPTRGRAVVDGLDSADDADRVRARLGVLTDSPGLYPRLTPREHLAYSAALAGVPRRQIDAAVAEAADAAGLDGALLDRPTDGFSQGEQRRVALARALVHRPQNIVLDEPTNGLDVLAVRALRAQVRALADAGRCVLFASHVMQEVSAVCDRIVILTGGRVVAAGSPDALRDRYGAHDLEDAFIHAIGSAEGLQ